MDCQNILPVELLVAITCCSASADPQKLQKQTSQTAFLSPVLLLVAVSPGFSGFPLSWDMQTYRWQTLITFKSKISLCSLVTPERLAQWAKLLKHLICVLIYVFGFCSWYKPNQEISQILPEQVQSREKFFLILLMFVSVLTLKLFVSALTLKLWAIVETVMCLNIFFWARKLTKDKNSALITFFFYLIAIAFRMPQLKHVEKQVTIILSLPSFLSVLRVIFKAFWNSRNCLFCAFHTMHVTLGRNLPHPDRLSRCYFCLTLFPFSSFSSILGVGVIPGGFQHDRKRSQETNCNILSLEEQMNTWYHIDIVFK